MNRNTCDLEVITFNARGLGNFSKRKDVFSFLRCQTADIICLQELHIAPGHENVFKNQWGGRAWFAPVSSVAGGVGILIQNKLSCKLINFATNEKGSVIFLSLNINESIVKIVNVYGPPDRDDAAFFDEVFRIAASDQQDHLILCGDWNLTLDPDLDTYNYSPRDRRVRSRSTVAQNCSNFNIHDVWRVMNGQRKQFSWRKVNPVKCARLDFFLVSDSVLSKCLTCEILPGYRSDHSRVSLRLSLSSQPRGRGLWKLNCSLLKDLNYLDMVKQTISETIKNYACPIYADDYIKSQDARKDIQMTINDALFLEMLLMNIRSKTISYSVNVARERSKTEKHILLTLAELESRPSPTTSDINEISKKQAELQAFRSTSNEGSIIRSRARWYEEGEKGSSSYFFKLEKRHSESKQIPCLKVGDMMITGSTEILAELSNHFKELYRKGETPLDTEIDEYLKTTNMPRLTSTEAQALEEDITLKELGETLMKFSNNKSPGSDGFPYEFYKVFWNDIKHFVYRSLKYGLMKGELSITQREGLITLVPKPSKPRNLIASWRPITLLNSTYKMLAGTIANRLKKVLNAIIHPDQTAFMKNRFIGENIRITYDILWETYMQNKDGFLFSADFKTAFDVMNWNFLELCLKRFNFGQKFIDMFWCLHKHIFSRIVYHGHLSKEQINLERGCRQGDPISCYFFIIGAEILANKVRQNEIIRGIQIREANIKLIQYADDTTFFLDGTERSLRAVFGELGWFSKFSGLKPNVSKCNAMWIGGKALSREKICTEIPLNWVSKLKLLGVVFSPHCQNITDENVTLKKDTIARIIGMWKGRNLSLLGRITVTKSLLLSQITHVLSSLPDPSEKVVKEISKLLFTFVWGSNRNPTKRIRLSQQIQDNGLAMIDISSYIRSLKMKWIKRIVAEKHNNMCKLMPSVLQKNFIWNYGIVALKKVLKEISNPFWKGVVEAWIYFSSVFPIPEELICNENVFHSDHTKFKNLAYPSWERKGIRIIGDLYEGNKLLTWPRFKERYNLSCNYLEYNGLLHSLPKELQKDKPNGWYQHHPSISARLQFLLSNVTFTKILVRSLMKNSRSSNDIDRINRKWIRDIGDFEPLSVLIVKNSSSATRYISFQFKLVMRILTTNSFLFLIKRRENERCSFCDCSPETLLHLFVTCPFVERFWNDVGRSLSMLGLGELPNKTKIFGDRENCLITHVVTVAKCVIYEARFKEVKPSLYQFKASLKRDFESEKFIAMRENELDEFNRKWSALVDDMSIKK